MNEIHKFSFICSEICNLNSTKFNRRCTGSMNTHKVLQRLKSEYTQIAIEGQY